LVKDSFPLSDYKPKDTLPWRKALKEFKKVV